MIEDSPISSKYIYQKFKKLQRTSSDNRFRIKSLRVNTVSNQIENHINSKLGLPIINPSNSLKNIKPHLLQTGVLSKHQTMQLAKIRAQSFKVVERNYEQQLVKIGMNIETIKQIFISKCKQTDSKTSQQKYQVFIKNMAHRLCYTRSLSINNMGFGQQSFNVFLNWFTFWQGHIIDLDLSAAQSNLKQSKMKIIKQILSCNQRLKKLTLNNSGLNAQELQIIFKIVSQRKILFSLDVGNRDSQNLNRFSDNLQIIKTFISNNQSVSILKLNNLHLKFQGIKYISQGIFSRKTNPLKVLYLSNNHIGGIGTSDIFISFMKSGLTHLNLSHNPLAEQFYKNLTFIKNSTVRQLDLSYTSMNSESLYFLFQKIQECKSLSILKLDGNDYSHHWFGKIGDKLQTNSSLEFISMNDCSISSFFPLFNGLIQNKYIKKLHANNNSVQNQYFLKKAITQCLIYNKQLQQIKMRCCNLAQSSLITIFQNITNNKKIKVIDFSQNLLTDQGAQSLLKCLQNNLILDMVIVQKMQLSQQMLNRIQKKVEQNKHFRQKNNLNKLRQINSEVKQKDIYSWQDLQQYQIQSNKLQNKLKIQQSKVNKLQQIAKNKKQKLTALTAQIKQEQRKMDAFMKQSISKQNDKVRQAQKQNKKIQKQQEKLRKQLIQEQNRVKQLQKRIKQVNQQTKIKQNEFQQKLRNLKYKYKKKQNDGQQRKKSTPHCIPKQI